MRPAAFLYDAFGADGWVTAATYDRLEADAFDGPVRSRSVLGRDGLSRALDEYDPVMGLVNRDLVLKHHQDRKHTEAWSALFRRVTPSVHDRPTAAAELARLSRLRWKAELEAGDAAQPGGRADRAAAAGRGGAATLSEQRRRRRARAARGAEDRLAELGETVDAAE